MLKANSLFRYIMIGTTLLILSTFMGTAITANLAHAGAIIQSGPIYLGVNDEGHLNFSDPTGAIVTSNAGPVGIAYQFGVDDIRDATSPGCLCEGWGVSANGSSSGYANVSVDGVVNLTVDSFSSTASSITSVVSLTSLPGLSVSQVYAPTTEAPNALFEDVVTITNTTGGALTDLKYVRVMDWDVPPTEFAEYVTIQGTATTTLLERSHDNGFDTANPLAEFGPLNAATADVDFIDDGPSDHGAYFRFNFGDLADGESQMFKIFYGAAATEADALAALGLVGAELFSLGQSSTMDGPTLGTPATYIFGFSGVGGVPIPPPNGAVPEPATLILLGSGLGGLALFRKKFKKA